MTRNDLEIGVAAFVVAVIGALIFESGRGSKESANNMIEHLLASVPILAFAICVTVGAVIAYQTFVEENRVSYTHNSKQLTQEDRSAIEIVGKSPLGNPAVMRPLFDYMGGDSSKPLDPCDYSVSKVIERSAPKDFDGNYRVRFEVTCSTQISGDSVGLEYTWTVDDESVLSFEWGTQPID